MIETMSLDTSWNALLRPWISNRYFDVPCPPPFETGAPDCSWINAWWLCELSRLIYRQGPDETGPQAQLPERSEILKGVGLLEIETFSCGTNHCALVESRNAASQPFAARAGPDAVRGRLADRHAHRTGRRDDAGRRVVGLSHERRTSRGGRERTSRPPPGAARAALRAWAQRVLGAAGAFGPHEAAGTPARRRETMTMSIRPVEERHGR